MKQLEKHTFLTLYHQRHYQDIGREKYLKSHIRSQHGTGAGFGGIPNGGSSDCSKEKIRNFHAKKLGADNKTIDRIYFKTFKGSQVSQNSRTRNNFTPEHTLGCASDLYPAYEEKFHMTDKKPSSKDILYWLISNPIATGIHPTEQKRGEEGKVYKNNNFKYPFSKYSAPVFYKGKDVSSLTFDEIKEINITEQGQRFKDLDFDEINRQAEKMLSEVGKIKQSTKKGERHLVAPLDIASKYHDDEIGLLNNWYYYKKYTLFNPKSEWSKGPKALHYRKLLEASGK